MTLRQRIDTIIKYEVWEGGRCVGVKWLGDVHPFTVMQVMGRRAA